MNKVCTNFAFQPVFTGDNKVFAFEALVRPVDTSVEDYLNNNSKYSVEKNTFFNGINNFLWFGQFDSHLLLNSFPNMGMKEGDYERLENIYDKNILSKLIIEILEPDYGKLSLDHLYLKKKYAQKWGAALAVDDFLPSKENYFNIRIIEPDYLKIDRNIISNINKDIDKQKLLFSLIDFVNDMSKKPTLLAEGIETKEEYEYLKKLGCIDLFQGFFLSKPILQEKKCF